MYILLTHPLHIFGAIGGKNKTKEGMINPERVHVREGVKMSHLHGCSVIKVSPISRLPALFSFIFLFSNFLNYKNPFNRYHTHICSILYTVWHWPTI